MNEAPPPIVMTWEGDAFTPVSHHAQALADKHYVIGERYALVPYNERSQATHRHYFACIHDAWLNLPDELAQKYLNPERLRKHALIKAGYADSQIFVCASKAEAERLQAFIEPIDEFSIIERNGPTVTRWTAKHQNMRAMDRKTFQASKEAVLDIIAAMIGTTQKELAKNGAI